MIRFLADADFNHAIVTGCRREEPAIDFLSANEAQLEGVPDPDVLAVAVIAPETICICGSAMSLFRSNLNI